MNTTADWPEQRRRMVERQLRRRGIFDENVLAAMLEIPRHEFIPEDFRHLAYLDEPVPIGHSQTASQPFMVAFMAQMLRLKPAHHVLEIGAGCGYHAAVLGAVAADVVAVEILPELAEFARRNLEATGRGRNVRVVCGDGSEGWAELAPYDAVSVAAAAAEVPAALIEQLKEGGRLVMPVGPGWEQELRVGHKVEGEVYWRATGHCRFVPLRGSHAVPW